MKTFKQYCSINSKFRKKQSLLLLAAICSFVFQNSACAQSTGLCKASPIALTQEAFSLCELFIYAIETNNFDTLSNRYQNENLNDSVYSELFSAFKINSGGKLTQQDIEAFELLHKNKGFVSAWKKQLRKAFTTKFRNETGNIEFKYLLRKEDINCTHHSGCTNDHGIIFEPMADKELLINIKGDMPQATFEILITIYDSPKYGLIIKEAEMDVDRKPLYSKLTSVENRQWNVQNGSSQMRFDFDGLDRFQLLIDGQHNLGFQYVIEGSNMLIYFANCRTDGVRLLANEPREYVGKGYFSGNKLILDFTDLKIIASNVSLGNKQFTLVRR